MSTEVICCSDRVVLVSTVDRTSGVCMYVAPSSEAG